MFSVLVKGFPTKEEAEQFISWFDGQGEQDATVWFEINNEANGGTSPMTVHESIAKKNPVETGEILEMTIKME